MKNDPTGATGEATPALDRRSFLVRFGLAAGVANLIAAAVNSATSAPIEEDPRLVEIAKRMVTGVADLQEAAARHLFSVDQFQTTRPSLPAELRDQALWARDPGLVHESILPTQLMDGFGHDVWESGQPVRFMSSAALADARTMFDGRTVRARRYRQLVPIAEHYETSEAVAFTACDVEKHRHELERQRLAVLGLGHELFDVPARTMAGIEIKAGGFSAVPLLGKPFEWVSMQWGPKLAENLLAVLATTGGAA